MTKSRINSIVSYRKKVKTRAARVIKCKWMILIAPDFNPRYQKSGGTLLKRPTAGAGLTGVRYLSPRILIRGTKAKKNGFWRNFCLKKSKNYDKIKNKLRRQLQEKSKNPSGSSDKM